jgi:hypothetical protein
MATYKEIFGKQVKFLSSDPTNESEGQIWYNSTSNTFKSTISSGVWSSASPYLIDVSQVQGAGSTTSALAVGGFADPEVATVGSWNGSGWTTETDYPFAGYGTTVIGATAPTSLAYGGYSTAYQQSTNEYDGSTWTTTGNFPVTIRDSAGAGTQTAGLGFDGNPTSPSPPHHTGVSAEYDGSTWTAGNSLNTPRRAAAGGGTQTVAFCAGGQGDPGTPNIYSAFEQYDGTSWTTNPASLNEAKWGGATQLGTTGATCVYAGGTTPPFTTNTESFDGTSWTEGANMATARGKNAGSGTASKFLVTSGETAAARTTAVEEYNVSASAITAGAWASGGAVNTARQRSGGFGNAQTAAVVAGGGTAPPASVLDKSEEYDGTSWTEGNNINTARMNMTAFGVLTAGVLAGVGSPTVSYGGTTELYDGTTWTTGNPYAAPGANYRSSCGPSTSGLLAGGVSPAPAEMTNAVEEFDGTNWTAGGTLPQYQSFTNMAGTQTAAINGGGSAGPAAPGPVTANAISLEYNGTGWTTGPNGNLYPEQQRSFNGGSGTQTAALFVGGETLVGTAKYDGTSFATAPNIAAARGDTSAAGIAPSTAAIIFCGSPVPGVGNTTEEFTGETTAANYKTITTS